MPSPREEASAELRARLRVAPRDAAAYDALHQVLSRSHLWDEADCVACALAFLGAADAKQRAVVRRRISAPIRPKRSLDDRHWLTLLAPPSQDLIVSKLFQQLWPAVLSVRGKTDREAGLQRRFMVDPAQSTITLARTFGFAAALLGIPAPRLCVRPDVQGGLTSLPVWPLASLCGATLLQGFSPPGSMFVVGHHLADYRGEHYVRTMLPDPIQLRALLLAAFRVVGMFPAHPHLEPVATELGAKLGRPQREVIATLARRLVAAGRDVDLATWLRSVELTACRAGLLMCDDVGTAAAMVRALGARGPLDLPVNAKIDELLLFSVSDEYFALRRALGIASRVG